MWYVQMQSATRPFSYSTHHYYRLNLSNGYSCVLAREYDEPSDVSTGNNKIYTILSFDICMLNISYERN